MPKKTPPKAERLIKGRRWVSQYAGQHLIKGYRQHFGVDKMTAIRAALFSSAQSRAHIESILQILRELLLTHFLLVLLIEASHIELAVVIHLQGVAAGINLNLTIQSLEALGDLFRLLFV